MLTIIARESKTVEEYAHRIEAWAATEAAPLDDYTLAWAWAHECGRRNVRVNPEHVQNLIEQAREKRLADRERRMIKLARRLR